jgi:hypothetical protein
VRDHLQCPELKSREGAASAISGYSDNASGEVEWIIHSVEDVTEVLRLEREQTRAKTFAFEQQRLVDQLRIANEALVITAA